MLSNFVLSQILIAVAICVDILSFQFKERRKILACLVISTLFHPLLPQFPTLYATDNENASHICHS
ncbi:MAG: YgjV family protein [Ardenticatenales bacterium]|nr:YgjV family protein [Ardenticatenales bacterium]